MDKEVENKQEGPAFSFIRMEESILRFWEENQVFKKSLEKTCQGLPYIFYDGPPFATGLPHHGHLVGSTLKDIIPRYFTMKGRYVERRFGWDCHGLPVEHEIDKKLKIPAHEAVKKLGVKGYNNECRSIVSRYTQEWRKTINRLGRWVDFDNDYKTMDTSFMESVWWVFKQLWDKNLIYKGTKVMPLSTSLGTVLSNFEAGLNYQDVQDPAITVLFKIDNEDSHIMVWTTTPWTLPSNLAVCVNENLDYVKVFDEDLSLNLILAKDRLEAYQKKRNLKIVEEFKGLNLKGKTYRPLFPYFADLKENGAFQILTDDYVTSDSGTGAVHIAPSFGEDDNRVMKQADLHFFACPIDNSGKFTNEVSDYENIYVKDADKLIIKRLKEEGSVYEQSVIVHSYPFCYRSNTPLLYKAIPSWFVKVETLTKDLIKSNSEIHWVPDHVKEGRFGKWLEGARDWAISRNRVWGTPLPIWENDVTHNFICIESIEELKKYTGEEVTDLHREFVDDLTFEIPGEEGTYRRISEVLDCWFESGSMPYAQIHYPFENKDLFEKGFPAEFIAEGLDQTRGWFYTLTVISTALFGSCAFKNVIVNGLVSAEDGKKMSKSLRNFTPPDALMDEFGADALRLYLINSGLVKGEEQRFSDSGVKDMVRRALLPWYNSFKFFQTYASIDNLKVSSKEKTTSDNIVDKWILSNLQTLLQKIEKEMAEYKLYNVVPALFQFIEDLTNWYIRLNRSRFWSGDESQDKMAAYKTLFTTIKQVSVAMAPFAPFLSEFIFQELKSFEKSEEGSVHLCDYPTADSSLIDSSLEDAVSRMQQIILLGRQKRNQVQIKTKTPLRKLFIIHKDKKILQEIKKLDHYIQSELNVKEIEYTQDESKFINLYARPNAKILGKKLGKDFKKFMGIINNLSEDQLQKYEENGEIDLEGVTFGSEDILIYREAKEGTQAISNRFISIDLDCNLDEELISEGLAREVVNRIQKTRKEMQLNVEDRIHIHYHAPSRLEESIKKHSQYISKETLAVDLTLCSNKEVADFQFVQHDIEKMNLKIHIEKSN